MSEITREEFKKIYDEKFVPILEKLEPERVVVLAKAKKWALIVGISLFVLICAYCLFNFIKSASSGTIHIDLGAVFPILFISVLPALLVYGIIASPIRAKLKKEVIPKVLSIYGNLYFSPNPEAITLHEMQSCGLFPRASKKMTDDVIVGAAKECNFVISESSLEHTEGSGKDSRTVTDFKGLVVKIQMKKNFTGKTVVGLKGRVSKKHGFEKVELESVDFMKLRDVFATDQIEARYILTTAFIERLDNLATVFNGERADARAKTPSMSKMNPLLEQNFQAHMSGMGFHTASAIRVISAAFFDGFVYLFIPSDEDFFEVDLNKTLLNFEQYYKIYKELDSILSVIDHLNLNSKTGL